MVHGYKPGKYVNKLFSYHKVGTNPWFQTMILHEVIVSNHISYFKTITLSSNILFQTIKAKHKSWFPNHEHCLPNHDAMVCQTHTPNIAMGYQFA
jgi:hypothetical protein